MTYKNFNNKDDKSRLGCSHLCDQKFRHDFLDSAIIYSIALILQMKDQASSTMFQE